MPALGLTLKIVQINGAFQKRIFITAQCASLYLQTNPLCGIWSRKSCFCWHKISIL